MSGSSEFLLWYVAGAAMHGWGRGNGHTWGYSIGYTVNEKLYHYQYIGYGMYHPVDAGGNYGRGHGYNTGDGNAFGYNTRPVLYTF